ncbi:hypothetical protein A3I27_00140 [Candidatus Giovannonibacteria bacterium RIFCSPLOWO2_02_FULL_43_11b]|uniref:NAD-dependent epimerase/dehydratase domain-containing protein n=1 Tax=Candidatus Giovannonibacteria bacterium RIFCSPHIGHO2_12_FULL_43_15 TaxID=1798341 RepID=A0A1F5WQH6_9BACT|nr:MAG: hypothetical protein A2739_02270 [Candidatus Giovannonibacteria bacterium RIFCSPHIGHO2_01_FULL_43_100]OGF67011.1 MAG: hypothetical protein A3B97_00225 [Candidatus Giovannonibacteria bacterium RIFCSPHIGHO2_02_FULL_43_32]OGF77933.1 MAG: hypothetical protein A3F23_04350 [Candidatus Giovannonibacteria bacterium RIFCSPHIGHO2_12_FULL_43_15]OGF78708.1 MAG: hypothetical protein A3A15_02025 [Candidatus Giovannonibacteria bacterium RIFCSPLOWO2_01_FULL_43_60]OGF89393.1 MAG: hypothetical protein A3
MKSKNILITGGAGFIGYHLAKHLLRDKEVNLVLVDNLQRYKGKMDEAFKTLITEPRVKFLQMDLTDPSVYKNFGGGYEQVYHLAAINGTKFFYEMPHDILRKDTLMNLNILEWFRKENGDGKFAFTSSCEAYAGGLKAFGKLSLPTPENIPLVVEDPYNARWSYAAVKIIGEMSVIHYAQAYNFKGLILRPHNFYGPRDIDAHVIPDFFSRILRKTDPFVINGADNTRDFCYIDDAVKAMKLSMDSGWKEDELVSTINIGTGIETPIRKLAEVLFDVVNWHPKELEIRSAPVGSVDRRVADISKIQKLTGWKPLVSLADGLRETYNWHKSYIS